VGQRASFSLARVRAKRTRTRALASCGVPAGEAAAAALLCASKRLPSQRGRTVRSSYGIVSPAGGVGSDGSIAAQPPPPPPLPAAGAAAASAPAATLALMAAAAAGVPDAAEAAEALRRVAARYAATAATPTATATVVRESSITFAVQWRVLAPSARPPRASRRCLASEEFGHARG
jgi:hypothetical protein